MNLRAFSTPSKSKPLTTAIRTLLAGLALFPGSTTGCSSSLGHLTPAPEGASAEVRALGFLVGDFTSSSGSMRCAYSASGQGVDCVEDVALDDRHETDRFAIRWSPAASVYQLDVTDVSGSRLSGVGTKNGERIVFTTEGPALRRYTFEAFEGSDRTLHVVAEACVESKCHVLSELRLEPPFVTPPRDRNG